MKNHVRHWSSKIITELKIHITWYFTVLSGIYTSTYLNITAAYSIQDNNIPGFQASNNKLHHAV